VCIYSPFLYPVTAEGTAEFAGGTEVRQWAIARALAARQFDVTIATCDFGQEALVVRDKVTLARTYSIQAGVPIARLFYPRLWKAFRALLAANADVYVATGAGIPAGWAYDASRLRKVPFVFLAAHDWDAIPSLPFLTQRRDRWWYRRALVGADARVAQSEAQRALFREHFSVDAEVIPNPVELPAEAADAGTNNSVLWLSTYRPHKRPTWFIELARRLPQLHFVMVGLPAPGEGDWTWSSAQRAATEIPNLEVHGFLDHARVGEYLSRAAVFVHTSQAEGFPMTLLEAWSYGIPSVTAVDPGNSITHYGLGEVVTTIDGLTDAVGRLLAAPERRRQMGERARRYVESHHGPAQSYEPLAALLNEVIEHHRAGVKRNG
jgi:glycosyltransferase involved in cell wall biosynthesis